MSASLRVNWGRHYHLHSLTSAKVPCSFANELGSVVRYDFGCDPESSQDIAFDE